MENKFKPILPISNYCLSEHTNNLYKKEAGSSLGLARDVAEKLNELINAFNELGKSKWEKIHELEGTIRKAILYMKDNLLNTINQLLELKGVELIDNSVEKHLGSIQENVDMLTTRLNEILGSVTEGSTTLDAEVIDLRTSFDGLSYSNAGVSVRSQIEGAYKGLNKVDISSYKVGFIRSSNGTIKEASGYKYSDPIEITHSKLLFKGDFKTFSDCDLINFYCSNEINEGTFLTSWSPTKKGEMEEVVVHSDATHFVVCTSDQYYGKTSIYKTGENYQLKELYDLILKPIDLDVDLNGYFIRANGSKVESAGMVISHPIEVTHTKLFFKGHDRKYSSTKLIHFYTNTEVSFYGYLGSYEVTNARLQEIPIPEGTRYIRVCTGTNVLPLTQLFFGGELKPKTIKTAKEIMMKIYNDEYPYVIKFIGDSIVAGYGGSNFNNTEPGEGNLIYGNNYSNIKGYCWVNLMGQYLLDKFGHVEYYNYGVNGIGSDVLLSKMSTLINEDDNLIICAVGTNDRVEGKDAYTGVTKDLNSIYKNMVGIYTYAKRVGKEIIFISPIPSSNDDEEGRTYHTEDIANLYTKLSVEFGIEVIDMHKLWSEYLDEMDIPTDMLLCDGLHPNDEGYQIYFRKICRALGFATKLKDANW